MHHLYFFITYIQPGCPQTCENFSGLDKCHESLLPNEAKSNHVANMCIIRLATTYVLHLRFLNILYQDTFLTIMNYFVIKLCVYVYRYKPAIKNNTMTCFNKIKTRH